MFQKGVKGKAVSLHHSRVPRAAKGYMPWDGGPFQGVKSSVPLQRAPQLQPAPPTACLALSFCPPSTIGVVLPKVTGQIVPCRTCMGTRWVQCFQVPWVCRACD